MKNCKRILVFVLAAVLLVSAVPPQEAKAEEYLTLEQVLAYYDLPTLDLAYEYWCLVYFSSYYYLFAVDEPNLTIQIKDGRTYWTGVSGSYYMFVDQWYEYDYGGNNSFSGASSFRYLYSDFTANMPDGYENPDSGLLDAYMATPTSTPTPTPSPTPAPTSTPTPIPIPECAHVWLSKDDFNICAYSYKTWEECSDCGAIRNVTKIASTEHVYDGDEDDICNVCGYDRHIEKVVDFIDSMPVILSLFMVFPLNVFLALNFVMMGVLLYREMKKK